MPKIKNIIIFTVIAALLILVYIFFIKPAPAQQNLVSSSVASTANTASPNASTLNQNSSITQQFLTVLLSINNITLNDAIFSDTAFINLHDSSIFLTPPSEGDKGRVNPFAPIGYETAT